MEIGEIEMVATAAGKTNSNWIREVLLGLRGAIKRVTALSQEGSHSESFLTILKLAHELLMASFKFAVARKILPRVLLGSDNLEQPVN
jgi:hypothetical protein